MKFKVKYPTGAEHEVELEGTVAVLGRDPSCDLVLNDPRCSRRHAVLEAGPQGISIRDAGSANGVYVNGQRLERASLNEGDVIRLGEVQLTVLAEDVPGTLVMGPEDMADMSAEAGVPPVKPPAPPPPVPPPPAQPLPPTAPAPPPSPPAAPPPPPPRPEPPRVVVPSRPAAPPRPAPPAVPPAIPPPPIPAGQLPLPPERSRTGEMGPAGVVPRPLTVTVLAALWALSILLYGAGGLLAMPVFGLRGTAGGVTTIGLLLLAFLSALMAFGLWTLAGWARILQLVAAAVGVLLCFPTIASIATLAYMLRPDVALAFSGRRLRELSDQEAEAVRKGAPEGLFVGAIVAGLAIPVLCGGGFALFTVPSLMRASAAANEASAIGDLRSMISAQAIYATYCNGGYGDLPALTQPASVVPAITAPLLLEPMAAAERHGYRFQLLTQEPLPGTESCQRSFRRYAYSATPLDTRNRSFLATDDGLIHEARGRPAEPGDPPLP